MAGGAHIAEPARIASHDPDRAGRWILAQAARVFRSGLFGRGRLYGPRQLGNRSRRRFGIRLHAAQHHSAFEPAGDPFAGTLRTTRNRDTARPLATLSRALFATAFH